MTDWLEESEARVDKLLSWFGPPEGAGTGWVPDETDVLVADVCDDDIPRLLAEVRALRAQVAAYKGVAEAMRQLPLGHLFALVAAQDSRWDEAEDALLGAEAATAELDAALAALEGEE